VEGSCEHGNELSGSIKCWEILEWLSDWQLLKKDSAPWIS
jgi:predicted deacylase